MSRRTPSPAPAVWLVLLLGLAPTAADAYFLPTRHILRKANQRLRKTQTLQVALVGRTRVADPASPSIGVGERWIFNRAGRDARVDVNGAGGRKAAWTRKGAATGDAAIVPTEIERVVFSRLFADGDVRALAHDLHVDTEVLSLGLLGERVAFVLGAAPGDADGPQIWIDQDSFLVLRVRFRAGDGRRVDVQLTGWTGPPTDGAFPQRVRVTIDHRWVRVLETDALRLNASPTGGR